MFEYLRACQVVAGTATGIRINLLRFKFKVVNSIKSYPSALTLEIYNLNRSEQTRFEKEFTRIFVFAGYVYSPTAQPKMIFSGNIKNVVFRKGYVVKDDNKLRITESGLEYIEKIGIHVSSVRLKKLKNGGI